MAILDYGNTLLFWFEQQGSHQSSDSKPILLK